MILEQARGRTPFLVVDEAVVRRNLAAMADRAAALGVALRPHAKTHKTVELADLQVEYGARGLTVATLGEAEVYADHGHRDLFVAYPLWWEGERADRLRALAERADLTVAVDSAESVRRLARTGARVRVLVEVDSGHRRSGVAPEQAGPLAVLAAEAGLPADGVFTFPGHSYDPLRRAAVADQEDAALREAAAACAGHGIAARVVSGGSTPTMAHSRPGTATELRPGVYVFGDAQQWELGVCSAADVALTAYATVVSRTGRRIVLDVGSKVLGADRAPWASGFGRLLDRPDARLVLLSEHHAVAELGEYDDPPALGSIERVVPNHACNAVNLVDHLIVERADAQVTRWAVAARGRNG